MAVSTCPKCDSHTFEIVENTPKNSKFKLQFVQCSKCGAVIGVMDSYNIGSLLHKLAKAMNLQV